MLGIVMFHAKRIAFCLLIAGTAARFAFAEIAHLQGEMAGEVTVDSVILQSRLTVAELAADGDVPGMKGIARFEIADNREFENSRKTPWIRSVPEKDFLIKKKIVGLAPKTKYYYRLIFGEDRENVSVGSICSFRTLYPKDEIAEHHFVVVTGMNYGRFHGLGNAKNRGYKGPDKHLGYPALVAIEKLRPDFFVGTGDNIYYDGPERPFATNAEMMRKKWHEQFVQPRYISLFSHVPTYWEKDDHDHRYDDCDTSGARLPLSDLGIELFKEQVPITDPDDPQAVTYRTHRVGKLLQIWMPENRDYRSPNRSPDGPDKTIWGKEQREWIEKTLLASDATFKIFISPTPMIGPDDLRKKDNHTDIGGFRHEGEDFLRWAKENGMLEKNFYFVCGDRHWQYQSIHPLGFEEFSTGALVDANSRLGVKPGSKRGTDPDAKIIQPYTSQEPTGGFLHVVVTPAEEGKQATLVFDFHDEQGKLLYSVKKNAVGS